MASPTDLLSQWRDDLAAWAIPAHITAAAAESPWALPRQVFARRADLPSLASEFELSAAQCHVLHLMEPDRPIPMGRIAEALACDASNVTGLVDRLESRGLA